MPQPDSTLRGVIALDSMRDRDMVHMRKMHSLFPGVDLARLPFSGHPAGQVIREGGAYQTLVNEAIAPHPSAQNIVATYRAVRRQSPSYFRRRARSLRPRWPDLADLAQVQHKNLRPH